MLLVAQKNFHRKIPLKTLILGTLRTPGQLYVPNLNLFELFRKVVVQTFFFFENKMTLTTLSRSDLLSFSPIEIVKVNLREIVSRKNREIKCARN